MWIFNLVSLYRLMQLCFWVAKPALLPTLHTLELLIALGKGVILLTQGLEDFYYLNFMRRFAFRGMEDLIRLCFS